MGPCERHLRGPVGLHQSGHLYFVDQMCFTGTPLVETVLSISDDVAQSQDELQQFTTYLCQGNESEVSCLAPVSLLEDGLDQRPLPSLGVLACWSFQLMTGKFRSIQTMLLVFTESRVFKTSSIWCSLVADWDLHKDPTMSGSVFFSVCT